jgi:CO/xanthine dehydrogenase Mo-binding subunit
VPLVDMGIGDLAVHAQIVAEELGLRADEIIVTETDTNSSLYDVVTHASRSTYVSGMVARAAAAKAKEVMLDMGGRLLEVAPADLEVREGSSRSRARRSGG